MTLKINLFRRRKTHLVKAFSLVEVLIALTIFSFTFVSLIGMIPLGLTAARDNGNRLHLKHVLSSVSDCMLKGTTDSSGNYLYPLSNDKITLIQEPGASKTYGLLSNGRLCYANSESDQRIGTIRIEQGSPNLSSESSSNATMPVFISIAVPQSAIWEDKKWQRHQESIETILFVPYQ
ncbi:MAG: hypothetical protein AAF984_06470 [Verrucomicrobiota bacterium]